MKLSVTDLRPWHQANVSGPAEYLALQSFPESFSTTKNPKTLLRGCSHVTPAPPRQGEAWQGTEYQQSGGFISEKFPGRIRPVTTNNKHLARQSGIICCCCTG
ncbi:unnamed protein product [Arctogadus glacialis]